MTRDILKLPSYINRTLFRRVQASGYGTSGVHAFSYCLQSHVKTYFCILFYCATVCVFPACLEGVAVTLDAFLRYYNRELYNLETPKQVFNVLKLSAQATSIVRECFSEVVQGGMFLRCFSSLLVNREPFTISLLDRGA